MLNEYFIHWRLIVRCASKEAAMEFLSKIEAKIESKVDLVICEPFSESEGFYDCVFNTFVMLKDAEGMIEEANKYSSELAGEWIIEDPRYYDSGQMEIQAAMSAYDNPEADLAWGHFWIRNYQD